MPWRPSIPISLGRNLGGGMSDLERLLRWAGSGAHWQLRVLTKDRAEVELLTCDRGIVVDVVVSDDRTLIDYVALHPDSGED